MKHTQVKCLQYPEEKDLESHTNQALIDLENSGATIIDVQLSMADDRAHQILIVYTTKP